MRTLKQPFSAHAFAQRAVKARGKAIAAKESHFKLTLKIFGGDPFAKMILGIAGGMDEIADHAQHFGVIADFGDTSVPVRTAELR